MGSRVMISSAFVVDGLRPSAMTLSAMSRSVTTPIILLLLLSPRIGTQPISSFFMRPATTTELSVGRQQVGKEVMTSLHFIISPFCPVFGDEVIEDVARL